MVYRIDKTACTHDKNGTLTAIIWSPKGCQLQNNSIHSVFSLLFLFCDFHLWHYQQRFTDSVCEPCMWSVPLIRHGISLDLSHISYISWPQKYYDNYHIAILMSHCQSLLILLFPRPFHDVFMSNKPFCSDKHSKLSMLTRNILYREMIQFI